MINYNFVQDYENLTKGMQKELEDASKNLPSDFKVAVSYVYDGEDVNDTDLYAFPHNENNEASWDDICYFRNLKTEGIEIEGDNLNANYNPWNEQSEICNFHMNNLNENYDFIDLYIFENKPVFDRNKETKVKEVKISVTDFLDNKIFSYSFEPQEKNPSFFIGTLAKSSTGWKFHPSFRELDSVKENRLSITKKYDFR